MRYRLRTLLIVLALGPMLIAGSVWTYRAYREATMTDQERAMEELGRHIDALIKQKEDEERAARPSGNRLPTTNTY
jgi:hypothetical protein